MTINQTLPVNQQPVIDDQGRMTVPWYRYFQNQNQAVFGSLTVKGQSLLGNTSSSQGYPSSIPLGQGLAFSGGQLICTVSFEAPVISWNNRTGKIVPQLGDYTFSLITDTPTTIAGYGITNALTIQQTMARVSLGF